MTSRKIKRDERGSCYSNINSPEHKQAHADASDMTAAASPLSLPDATSEPSLKDIHSLLIEAQGTLTALLKTNRQTDVGRR